MTTPRKTKILAAYEALSETEKAVVRILEPGPLPIDELAQWVLDGDGDLREALESARSKGLVSQKRDGTWDLDEKGWEILKFAIGGSR